MLRIDDLSVHIGAIQILESVSLELPAGMLGGLVGRNGAGKTTLMCALMGLIAASQGNVHFEQRDLLSLKTHERVRVGIGYMPEDRKLVPEFTC
jgi:branched-chain amino acid transport system ATP-binding protein